MGVDGDKLTWGASVEAGPAEAKLLFPVGSIVMADGHVIGVVEGILKEAQRIFILVSNRDSTSSKMFITAHLARGWKPTATREYKGWQRASLADLTPDQIRALEWSMAEHAAARAEFVNLKTPPRRPSLAAAAESADGSDKKSRRGRKSEGTPSSEAAGSLSKIASMDAEINKLKEKITGLNADNSNLKRQLNDAQKQTKESKKNNKSDLTEKHKKILDDLKEKHKNVLNEAKTSHKLAIEKLKEKHVEAIDELTS